MIPVFPQTLLAINIRYGFQNREWALLYPALLWRVCEQNNIENSARVDG